MIFVYIAEIIVVCYVFVLYFIFLRKKQEEKLAKLRQERIEEQKKHSEQVKREKEEKEVKKKLDDSLEDFSFDDEKEEAKNFSQSNPDMVSEIDISDVDFEALENMSDEDFDAALKKFSPDKRDAILDELLRRNED